MRHATLLPPLLALIACADTAPDEPTWARDVQPILAANCVRCHGVPVLGGAPSGFRLDVYDPVLTDDGSSYLGAGAMAEFVAARACDETMPPRFPLSDRQQEVLDRWAALAEPGMPAPRGGPAEGNRPPTIRPAPPGTLLDGDVLRYVVDDPDRDLVRGALFAIRGDERVRITRELHDGAGLAVWDPLAVPEGTYEIVARLDDGSGEVEHSLGEVVVEHPAGAAPSLRFLTALEDALFTDDDGPVEIALLVSHFDPDATLALTVEAVLGDEVVPVAELADVAPGEVTIPWDTAAVPAGDLWRLRATVSDGTHERTIESRRFIVGHGTTDLRYADVEPIFAAKCVPCHPGSGGVSRVPGLGFDFRTLGRDDGFGVYDFRGPIYRRAVSERTMPPVSAQLVISEALVLTDDERRRLGAWLLAGAPE